MERNESFIEKAAVFADVMQAMMLFVVMVAFWYMLAVYADMAQRSGFLEIKDFLFLAVVTALVLFVSFVLARPIAKLLPSTAGLPLFQHVASKCGHRTYRTGKVSAFGHTIKTKMPKNDDGSFDYCLGCIGKMAIRCAWCGESIFVGDPITLYTPGEGFEIPAHAVVHKEDPLQLVGCLRWDCAQTGGDMAGTWIPDHDEKGRVRRIPTAFEYLLDASHDSVVTSYR